MDAAHSLQRRCRCFPSCRRPARFLARVSVRVTDGLSRDRGTRAARRCSTARRGARRPCSARRSRRMKRPFMRRHARSSTCSSAWRRRQRAPRNSSAADPGGPAISAQRVDYHHPAAGRDVLAGQADQVRLNGIDVLARRRPSDPGRTLAHGGGTASAKRWYHDESSHVRTQRPAAPRQHARRPSRNDVRVEVGVALRRRNTRSRFSASGSFPLHRAHFERRRRDGPARSTRHWIISDADRPDRRKSDGDGVIGEQPVLPAGRVVPSTSGCPLKTPTGVMRGTYQMVTEDGDRFEAQIAPFALHEPTPSTNDRRNRDEIAKDRRETFSLRSQRSAVHSRLSSLFRLSERADGVEEGVAEVRRPSSRRRRRPREDPRAVFGRRSTMSRSVVSWKMT